MSSREIPWATVNGYVSRYDSINKNTNMDLALRNFDLSYSVGDSHVAFVVLVTALESLMNVSNTELRYRVSRNIAVLLGKSVSSSEEISKNVRMFYDIRSQLVHTGTSSKFTEEKHLKLQDLVSQVLLKILYLNLPKEELINKLNKLGFGKSRSIS